MSYCCKSRKAVSAVYKNKNRGLGTVLFFLIFFISRAIHAGPSVVLSWNASTDQNVTGYYVYQGVASGAYTSKYNLGTNTTATISGLIAGQTNYFALTAYNAANAESPFSPAVAFIVPGVLQLTQGTSPGSVNINFPVAPGHWYEVQASVDLKVWTTISQTATETTNTWIQVSDPQSSLFSKRFYRLVLH